MYLSHQQPTTRPEQRFASEVGADEREKHAEKKHPSEARSDREGPPPSTVRSGQRTRGLMKEEQIPDEQGNPNPDAERRTRVSEQSDAERQGRGDRGGAPQSEPSNPSS